MRRSWCSDFERGCSFFFSTSDDHADLNIRAVGFIIIVKRAEHRHQR